MARKLASKPHTTSAKSAKKQKPSSAVESVSTPSQQPRAGAPAAAPVYAEPEYISDPTKYKTPHNFRRYTRTIGARTIPSYVIGNGGHGLSKLSIGSSLRTPIAMPAFAQPEVGDSVTLDNYDYLSYGYLRILVDAQQLRIEYHPASDGTATKTPDDTVTVNLATGTLVQYAVPSV